MKNWRNATPPVVLSTTGVDAGARMKGLQSQSKTILMVDDTEACREPIAALLRRAGYRILCAENLRRAATLLDDNTPDLLLLDVAMPDGGGIDFLRELRKSPQFHDLPVILFTGSGDVSLIAEGLNVQEVLVKSHSSMREIQSAIRRALAHPATLTNN